ncbi:Tify [Artemisia annua]|uniref:Protein TIFY n=1 Tax=Artemisia annua TaxID=35608 RepID=A0A2U1NBD5_ARTAN|nr:Tify [Artemisia annua]
MAPRIHGFLRGLVIWLALWVLRGDQRVSTGIGLFKEVSSLNAATVYCNLDSGGLGLFGTKIFHNFLSHECAPVTNSPSAVGVSSGPNSNTSDMGFDKQVVGSHLIGVPIYGERSDLLVSEIGNQYAGIKRSNSDSVFLGSSSHGVPQTRADYADSSHLLKQPKATGAKADANGSIWDRAVPVNVGPVMQYPSRGGQDAPYAYAQLSSRFKEANVAADEGSRTGIKGSGILSSVNVGGAMVEPSSGKQKSAITLPEPGSSTPLRWQGSTSATCQMTIFYGGQAHVFDDVHPKKADAILDLAGSGGGAWSTNLSSNSAVKPHAGEAIMMTGEPINSGLPFRNVRGRVYDAGNSSDQMSLLPGGHNSFLMTDARRPTRGVAEPCTEEKLELQWCPFSFIHLFYMDGNSYQANGLTAKNYDRWYMSFGLDL